MLYGRALRPADQGESGQCGRLVSLEQVGCRRVCGRVCKRGGKAGHAGTVGMAIGPRGGALLCNEKRLNLILCNLLHRLVLASDVENVNDGFPLGARKTRSEQRIVVGLLGGRRVKEVGDRRAEDGGVG